LREVEEMMKLGFIDPFCSSFHGKIEKVPDVGLESELILIQVVDFCNEDIWN
jgi:hypothetical protein